MHFVIDRAVRTLCVASDESLKEALKRIDANRSRVVFTVGNAGVLEGILTDGDFRRWAIENAPVDLSRPVSAAANRAFRVARINDDPRRIADMLSSIIHYVPLIDAAGRLVGVAHRRDSYGGPWIGERRIGEGVPAYVIAEIGLNHNGSLDRARDLVNAAHAAGADCAKFQMRDMTTLYRAADIANEDLGTQYQLDLLGRFQLQPQEMRKVFDYCRKVGITPLCTPWEPNSLAFLEDYGMQAYKIASADLTNHELLRAAAGTGKTLICSTGMSTEGEIVEAIRLLQSLGSPYVLLQCNSTYPAPFKDVHLRYMERLAELGGGCPVGYSGHERGYAVAIAAVARGASVIEKHLTLDRNLEGNDHKVSLLPNEFASMVEGIRQVEQALGGREERRITQGEMMNRVALAKSLVAARAVRAGRVVTDEDVAIRSPGRGLQPNRLSELLGKTIRRDLREGDFFFPSDLSSEQPGPKNYNFRRCWGVPVRYHDLHEILERCHPDFLEFHLSYKDLDLDPGEYVRGPYDLDLIVHSPDVFSGDHLLNLCSDDLKKRRRSVVELQRVADLARLLKPHFRRCISPKIVASVGGYSTDGHLPRGKRRELYDRIVESLAEVDLAGVEVLPQTLPPFPWYFGGQLYLNLFVEAEDTAEFCERTGYRLCLDISHSKLACNHYGQSFSDFLRRLAPHSAHLHVADASGLDGEGLQIEEGDIDFRGVFEILDQDAPKASFIPEIWQGHRNGGEGFWIALARLERYIGTGSGGGM